MGDKAEEGIFLQNAVIERTMLGWEGHGIFTFGLTLDYGGSGQTAGQICLSYSPQDYDRELFSPGGLEMIAEIMKTVGVREWEALQGKHVVSVLDRPYGTCIGLRRFLKPSKQIIFKDFAEGMLDRAIEDVSRSCEDREDDCMKNRGLPLWKLTILSAWEPPELSARSLRRAKERKETTDLPECSLDHHALGLFVNRCPECGWKVRRR